MTIDEPIRQSKFVDGKEYSVEYICGLVTGGLTGSVTLPVDTILKSMVQDDIIGYEMKYLPESCICDFIDRASKFLSPNKK